MQSTEFTPPSIQIGAVTGDVEFTHYLPPREHAGIRAALLKWRAKDSLYFGDRVVTMAQHPSGIKRIVELSCRIRVITTLYALCTYG